MALSANTERTYKAETYENTLPVAASTTIYKGSAVGDTGGYARALNAGDIFHGFATAKVDNSSGSAGDLNVELRKSGIVRASISSLAITDIGKAVYMSDDDTFTLTQGSNTFVGHVVRWVSTGIGEVAFNAAGLPNAGITELTDSTTGTPGNTLNEASGLSTSDTYSDAAVNTQLDIVDSNIASLAAKVNYLLRIVS